jgi:hypothetical protein
VDADNYSSGDDIVVEFLRLRFSFNAPDFAQRVCAAAFRLGLVDENELDIEETEDLVELTADGVIEEPRSELGRYLVRHWERLSLVDAYEKRVVEPGEFEVLVGGSSARSALQRATFRVDGRPFSYEAIPGVSR